MSVPGVFEKKSGIPTNADLSAVLSEKSLKIEKLNANFFNAQLQSKGQVTPLEKPMENLSLVGTLKADHTDFSTTVIAKRVNDLLEKTVSQLGEKIPALKGKKVTLPSQSFEYESIFSDFNIAHAQLSVLHFFAKAVPNKGIDLKGNAVVDKR